MSPIRELRHGYTTGSCATAAAKAATLAHLNQECVKEVEITLPKGEKVLFKVHSCTFDKESARCSVIKDGGDDPDVTNGAEIEAEVRIQNTEYRSQNVGWAVPTDQRLNKAFEFTVYGSQVAVYGGKGVGVITKPGLALPVGEPAINPVPRKMIQQAVEEVVSSSFIPPPSSFTVTISVPDGEQIARGTLNERLGIIGGISILGTTGIVKPISTKAWADTISVALDVAKAAGVEEVVLTTGRTSEKVAMERLKLPSEAYIQMGDHVGYSLRECVKKGFKMVTIAGQFGKFTKIASGEFETNVRDSTLELKTLSDIILQSLSSHQIDHRRAEKVAQMIKSANTARQAYFIIRDEGMEEIIEAVCMKVCENSYNYLKVGAGLKPAPTHIEVKCLLVGYEGEIVFAV
ncbi:MAG: cobalt-precorrin-5B (C(1))-methyltransferase [Deltaproteobacteria bacterium]|nr:cobalt-precorrin-5B (C(1))-methyltransferase [Deltaproteobacteria bacterium]